MPDPKEAVARQMAEALRNLIPRFEAACRHAGNDDETIALATERHRAALAAAEKAGLVK